MCCFAISIASAQSIPKKIQSDPKLVLKEVFRAANEQDYSNLSQLCPPNKTNDGDTQRYICDIASSSKQEINEFISYFKNNIKNRNINCIRDKERIKVIT